MRIVVRLAVRLVVAGFREELMAAEQISVVALEVEALIAREEPQQLSEIQREMVVALPLAFRRVAARAVKTVSPYAAEAMAMNMMEVAPRAAVMAQKKKMMMMDAPTRARQNQRACV